MTFILPSFGASAISAVPGGGGGGGGALTNSYSLDFDGTDDYLDTGSTFQSTFQSSYSISTWYKQDSTSGTQNFFGARIDSPSKNSVNLNISATSIFADNFINGSRMRIGFSNTADTTSWHHICMTVLQSGSNVILKIFLDGVFKNTITSALSLSNYASTLNFVIGAINYTGSPFSYFNGKLDETSIFGSALSDGSVSTGQTAGGDIATLYNSGTPSDISSLNPVGWWRMGDNDSGTGTTITDQGSGGNDGTLVNGPTFVQGVPSVPAVYSNTYSLDFDGTNDYVSTELGVAGQSELTVSSWVKLDNSSASRGIVTQYVGGGDRAFRLACFPTTSSIQGFWFEVYGAGSYAGFKYASVGAIPTGSWLHVAGVFSQSSCVCYVNGVASTTTGGLHNAGTGNIATCTDNIDIGRQANADYMDGKIDEVGIWTSALSASDITAIYNSGVPADISSYSPVLYYRMGDNDGGTGTTITDQGSSGNNGSLVNGPTFSTDVPVPGAPFTGLTYEINNTGGNFTLHSTGTVSFDVDWGDGNSESSTSNALAHTYAAGSYEIQVTPSGSYRPFFDNQNADLAQITSVEIDDIINLGTNLDKAWSGASNMTDFTASNATSTVTSFYRTWGNCSSLTSFPTIDTSSGTTFRQAWRGCSSLTSFPSLDFSNAAGNVAFNVGWYQCSSLANYPANMFDTTGAITSNAFALAFSNCALTAQSIENILTSLDTNGASNITLGMNGGTNAAYSTWSSAAQTALSNLQTKGWTVSYNT